MKFLEKVTYNEVILHWIRREYLQSQDFLRSDVPNINPSLISNPNLNDPIENKLRRKFLYSYRGVILHTIPANTQWFKIEINQKEDLNSFRLINEVSWNYLSNNTGKLDIAANNFITFIRNEPQIQNLTLQQWVNENIDSLKEFREKANDSDLNLTLILIALSQNGPFTVIEGNHTVMSLFLKHFIDNLKFPYKIHNSYVGLSPNIDRSECFQNLNI